jgi:hypothetical protein
VPNHRLKLTRSRALNYDLDFLRHSGIVGQTLMNVFSYRRQDYAELISGIKGVFSIGRLLH